MATHKRRRPTILEDLKDFARQEFGDQNVRADAYTAKTERNDFWVLTEDGCTESAKELSSIIAQLPTVEFGFLFVAPELKQKAKQRIDEHLRTLLAAGPPSQITASSKE